MLSSGKLKRARTQEVECKYGESAHEMISWKAMVLKSREWKNNEVEVLMEVPSSTRPGS